MLTPLPKAPNPCTEAANRIVVVASRYNAEFVEPMVMKALAEISLIEPNTKVDVVHAPGSFDIPHLARQAIERLKADAVICLGVIFQGETGHAELIAASVSDTLCRMSVETMTPVIHGVLLLDNRAQAQARCLEGEMNRGTEAARAAIETLRSSRTMHAL
jgi:6,7-dimethyl-8-ribityllumazine synthase